MSLVLRFVITTVGIFFGALLGYFFYRIKVSEGELKELRDVTNDLKTTAMTRKDLSELFDLKLAPTLVQLEAMKAVLDKISRTIPAPQNN